MFHLILFILLYPLKDIISSAYSHRRAHVVWVAIIAYLQKQMATTI